MALKRRHNRLMRHKPGTAPGTLVVPDNSPFPRMTVMAYDEDELVEKDIRTVAELKPFLKKWPLVWINVDGLGSIELIEELGVLFDLHPLALEDVLNFNHRPKAEDYGESLFMVARMARFRDTLLDLEQISLFAGRNYVLTFQERPGDCLEPVRERIRRGQGRRIRFAKSDYLVYAICDAIVDGYFPVLELYGDRLDELEDNVIANPTRRTIELTHEIKRDFHQIRHTVWPMREMAHNLSASAMVSDDTRTYFRDCYDHVIQVLDMLETYRERASGLVDIYLSSLNNRMNEVMKVLTIIATIFIPLSFIAGIYGMNFDPDASPWNMPELDWYFGYPFALGLMLAFSMTLLVYFWRKGWLKGDDR